jgi:hypothetical protein
MTIDWTALGKVAGVSLAFGVGIVVVFSLGLLGLSAAEGRLTPGSANTRGGSRTGGVAVAGACFLVCAAAVGYGIYLIVPQFH